MELSVWGGVIFYKNGEKIMNQLAKRFLSVLMALVLCLGLLPGIALAEGAYTVSFSENGTVTFTEVKAVITETGYSRLPVYNEDLDDIKGVLFVKDLLEHLSKGDEFGWQQLIREPYFIPMHKKVNSVLDDFKRHKFHMAIVVDEYGATQGLISLEGKTHIVDVTRVLDLDDDLFEDVQGRAETLAGLMLEINRNFLKKGEEVSAHGVRFVVDNIVGHRIDKIKIIVKGNE